MKTSNERSIAAITHLSSLSQYIIPFGNYIFPLLLWTTNKEKSNFVDHHGKQTLNFQLSILLYSLLFIIIAVPTFLIWLFNIIQQLELEHHTVEFHEVFTTQNITGMVLVGFVAAVLLIALKLAEFFLILYAAYKAADGEYYKYPLTINFIK